ncbi:MAG: hypothetical protein V1773_11995 [bacterium]
MDKLNLNEKYYKWDINSGDYKPEIDLSYKKYNKKKKLIINIFKIVVLAVVVSSIIVFFAIR